jgi:glycosyltransferase involved in cell wall biosynthesis
MMTHPVALRYLLIGQPAYFQQHGFEVLAVSSPGPDLDVVGPREGVQTIGLPMEREINPIKDFVALLRLIKLFRRFRPDVICAGTAKASLLGLVAARFTRVPARVYILHGLRLETTSGLKRKILVWAERLTASCAQRVICISQSLADVYAKLGLAPVEKLRVLGHGSSNGVNPIRYGITTAVRENAAQLRADWGLATDTPVIGFVGRLVQDKGVTDIIDAFDLVLAKVPNARLLMLGELESGEPISASFGRVSSTSPPCIMP